MKSIILFILLTYCLSTTYAQVGINADGSAPLTSAQLDVKSTTKGFYPPRMTTVEKEAIVGKQAGAVVYDVTLGVLSFYNGTSWVAASSGSLTLPYSQSMSSEGTLFSITNTIQPDNSYYAEAFSAKITGNAGTAIHAESSKTNPTYHTTVIEGYNKSTNAYGFGIDGRHEGSGTGVFGYAETGYGIRANAGTGIGGHFNSNNGYALTTGKGNVGIGTSTPAAKMDIKGTDYLSHFYYGPNEDTYLRGGKAGGHVLINDITGQGNVGIGNTNPGYLLDVNRRIRIRHTIDGTPDDNTAGIWYNNSGNVEAAFSGMKTDNQVGLFIGGNWRFWIDNTGVSYLNGGVNIGGGTNIAKVIRQSFPYNPDVILKNSSTGVVFPVTDAQVGDQVLVNTTGDMQTIAILTCYVASAGSIYIRLVNLGSVDVDLPSLIYNFTLIR